MHLRFIHVAAHNRSLLSFITEEQSILWMYHNMFIHSVVDGHLGCFQFGVIMSKAAVIIPICVFVWSYVFISLG